MAPHNAAPSRAWRCAPLATCASLGAPEAPPCFDVGAGIRRQSERFRIPPKQPCPSAVVELLLVVLNGSGPLFADGRQTVR